MPYLETEKEAAERILDFHEEKGKGYVNFPILLSKMYTNNSSKELKTNIKELLNHLCDNKQKAKQVYSDEKNRIKKNKKIDELNKINDRYKQEIQKLKKN